MFNFLKKIFGSDIPDTPVIAQSKIEPVQQKIAQPETAPKKAPTKKPATKATTTKKAPAKKPAATKTGDAPKRRGRPPKSSS